MRKKQKDWSKDMAYERIIRLFELAHIEFNDHPKRSDRYVQLARRIGMRYRVRMPQEFNRQMQTMSHLPGARCNRADKASGDSHINYLHILWNANEAAVLDYSNIFAVIGFYNAKSKGG